MLLLHQTGSVKVGEVARYTLTYTPSLDRILPPPQHLFVKIKNTSAIPLRAAYLHGPYTLYVSSYPSTFNPDVKQERSKEEGTPDYEPQLKAGGSWTSKLSVPDEVRESAEEGSRLEESERKSFTWIIEVASQVLFSTSAAVHYELLVGRDEKSVALGVSGIVPMGQGHGVPGKLEDLQKRRSKLTSEVQTKGVFSKAVRVAVDDTTTLWNTPPFPSWDDEGVANVKQPPRHGDKRDTEDKNDQKQRKQKKIHLVILTHGLHSNLGADMLYMKESIDSAAKQASKDAKAKRAEMRATKAKQDNEFGRDAAQLRSKSVPELVVAPTEASDEDEEDEEQVIVRGFNGNAVKTEKGIQYLGKRLAKYVLSLTYPDQPYLPVKSSISKSITRTFTGQKTTGNDSSQPIHKHSSIIKDEAHVNHNLAYKITSISFVGHSLGGLIQTYAVAYIHKHSPDFFDRITPINFVAMASPFLGLSNENPMYVKFALDFGLVGRTGQDLGLTWRPPTIARNGWGAMVNGLVNDPHKNQQPDPGSKPLLRILPTGPAHLALKRFRNRSVYSNVVNDGIVPLRTSCLLFLDWRGLGRVEKARRENGLVGTMVSWGWNEMTGQNASTVKKSPGWDEAVSDDANESGKTSDDHGSTVPDARASQFLDVEGDDATSDTDSISKQKLSNDRTAQEDAKEQESNMWNGLLAWFRPQSGSRSEELTQSSSKSSKSNKKTKIPKMYSRGQTTNFDSNSDDSEPVSPAKPSREESSSGRRRGPVRGSSLYTNNSAEGAMEAPPKTSIFESAGDLLAPPLPSTEFILDPAARPRTIFHDRVYHPDDIPAPPTKRQRTFMRLNSSREGSRDLSVPNQLPSDLDKISSAKTEEGVGAMKIEEKIARAYHKDMSWRKVLVSMEPDAHNNMIVRRMFANAYGWPVIKHLCDTHFAFTAAAQTKDDDEDDGERARVHGDAVGSTGEQVKGQVDPPDDQQVKAKQQDEKDASFQSLSRPATKSEGLSVDTKASRDSIKAIHDRVRSREQKTSDHHRTASEIRESRDEVSDLISLSPSSPAGVAAGTFSTPSQSGTAILHRLARQDSARWSDRFFEGSDADSSDEDAYFDELRRARERGEINDEQLAEGLSRRTSPRNTIISKAETSNNETRKHDQAPGILSSDRKVVAEPDSLSSTTASSRNNSTADDTGIDNATLRLTGIGLGKSAPDQVVDGSPTSSRAADVGGKSKNASKSKETNVSEQVAVAVAGQSPT